MARVQLCAVKLLKIDKTDLHSHNHTFKRQYQTQDNLFTFEEIPAFCELLSIILLLCGHVLLIRFSEMCAFWTNRSNLQFRANMENSPLKYAPPVSPCPISERLLL